MHTLSVLPLVAKTTMAWLGGAIIGLALNFWLSEVDGLVIVRSQTSSLITYSHIGFWGWLLAGYIACGAIIVRTIIAEIHHG